ncbi:DUF4767 domain-containing protein [Lactobacillus psittaci]|uniref:DUF4767 domain-containing protein n=1 Tax=Lactobacillus psittaci DSM 15354 TaxID=1122152 RepID=A0A0R1S5C6_9LACO|nr:DUF4767 domain-containing protein [Lactobacillus psittaci]KRL61890.1 hypothetical protein FC23_GL000439 [Lactobacillus psittaci DSM 15354]
MRKKLFAIAVIFGLFSVICSLAFPNIKFENQPTQVKVSRKAKKVESPKSKPKKVKQAKAPKKEVAKIWTKQKDQELTNFINTWGPKINQKYDKFDGKNQLKTYAGSSFPDDLAKATYNGQKLQIAWDPDLKQNLAYHIVAIFNHNGTHSHITYFFIIKDNNPIILVDNNSSAEKIYLTNSNNKELTDFYNQLIKAK